MVAPCRVRRIRRAPASVQAPRSHEISGAIFTGESAMIGTPVYMAPDLWWGDDASPRSDVFALGLVIYELICGRLPHAGLRLEDIARAIVEGTLPPLRDSTPEVPESLAQVIDGAVRRDAVATGATPRLSGPTHRGRVRAAHGMHGWCT